MTPGFHASASSLRLPLVALYLFNDTETKCRAGASNIGVNSPRLLYRSENFTPVRNFVTVSCRVSWVSCKRVRFEIGLPVDYNG